MAATEEEATEAVTVFAQQVSMAESALREQNGLNANGMVSSECKCVLVAKAGIAYPLLANDVHSSSSFLCGAQRSQ